MLDTMRYAVGLLHSNLWSPVLLALLTIALASQPTMISRRTPSIRRRICSLLVSLILLCSDGVVPHASAVLGRESGR